MPARYTVGVLVQTNFGGALTIAGVPVGAELGRQDPEQNSGRGSIIMVVATDAPIDARNLKRLAARSMLGLGRTGASAMAAATMPLRFPPRTRASCWITTPCRPLFQAAIDSTEEAIDNSPQPPGRGHTVEALPIDKTLEILRRHGVVE